MIAPARRPAEQAFVLLCKALPFAMLASMVITLLRIGIDIPFLDDWRDYAASTMGAYSLAFLFKPSNDTLYPVGKLLDSIFLEALGGNTLIYQAISMTLVLGSILWLTWRLLSRTIDDRLLAVSAFVPTLLILQADSYWGRQYLAYHQAIPLVCLLAIFDIMLARRWRPPIRLGAVAVLGLVAGGAYISGAFAAFGASLVLIATGSLRPHRSDLLQTGVVLAIVSAITSVAQAYVIVVVQAGHTHRADTPWSMPSSPDFWAFATGKIGRSLAIPAYYDWLAFALAAAAAVVLLVLVAHMIAKLAWSREMDPTEENRLTITITMATAIGIYLAMVTAGRANMRPAAIDAFLEVFKVGFARFHFFWITLIWPWALAALLLALRNWLPSRWVRPIAVISAVATAVGIAMSGAIDHKGSFSAVAAVKQRGFECMQRSLITAREILCPDLYPIALDALYIDSVAARASFTHAVPPTLRRYNSRPRYLLFEPDKFVKDEVKIKGVAGVVWNGNTAEIQALDDAQFEFQTRRPARMRDCRVLNVTATFTGPVNEPAQLFFRASGDATFSEPQSQKVASDGTGATSFTVRSASGFADALRLDPAGPGKVVVSDVSVHCLLP